MPEKRIFPVLDRRAPLLERVRGDSDEGETVEHKIGKRVGRFFKNDDERLEAEELAKAAKRFREGLAREMDVSEEKVSDEAIDNFTSLMKTGEVMSSSSETTEDEEEDEDGDEDGGPFSTE